MHYPSNAFAKHPGLETMKSKDGNRRLGNTQGLTEKDVKQVQRMYKCWPNGKKEGKYSKSIHRNSLERRWIVQGYSLQFSPTLRWIYYFNFSIYHTKTFKNNEIVHLQLYSCKQNIYKLLVILLVIELHTVKKNFVAFFVFRRTTASSG